MKQNRNGVMVFYTSYSNTGGAPPEFIAGASSWSVDGSVLNVYTTNSTLPVASFANWAGVKLVDSSPQSGTVNYVGEEEDEHQKP